jgi:trehalose 6-phosphate phosphatase
MINGSVLSSTLDHRLHHHLATAACSRHLLVATDFDGTLVELQDDPDEVWLSPRAVELLGRLATCAGVTVAVLSGRSLGDLRKRIAIAPGVRLVGSHGAEWEGEDRARLHPSQAHLLRATTNALVDITTACPGTWVERKPTGSVFHYRTAAAPCTNEAVRRVIDGPGTAPGVHLRIGKDCLELSVVENTKGLALDRLRHQLAAERVVFLGDDITDEDGFRVLAYEDVGIKVGPGPSEAEYRATTPHHALEILEELLRSRHDFATHFPAYV